MKLVKQFTQAINKLSDDSAERLMAALAKVDYTDITAARKAIVPIMESICGAYSDYSATVAAEFYNATRQAALERTIETVVDSGRKSEATESFVRATVQDLVDGKPIEEFKARLVERTAYEIRRAANTCVARNCIKDKRKVRFARVPSGAETCQWCIMLASRGAIYDTVKVAQHTHANCDCRIVPDYGAGISGYDDSVYYQKYLDTLQGHELKEELRILERNGKLTNRVYKTAAYDYAAAGYGKPKKKTKTAKKD